jgi:Tol biopolymer transport system component
MASGTDPKVEDFFIYPTSHSQLFASAGVSPDMRYSAHHAEAGITIENLDTNEQTLALESEGYKHVFSQWLPGRSVLAVLRTKDNSQNANESVLDFYDADENRLAASYHNIVPEDWSPDGSMMLYKGQGPCILKWQSGDHWCLDDGRRIHGAETVLDFRWSPRGDQVSLNYFDGKSGGLCVIDLEDGGIVCPTMGMVGFSGSHIREYSWSDDGKYLIFFSATGSCPHCDGYAQPRVGIVSIDGTSDVYPIDGLRYESPEVSAWRPAIAP